MKSKRKNKVSPTESQQTIPLSLPTGASPSTFPVLTPSYQEQEGSSSSDLLTLDLPPASHDIKTYYLPEWVNWRNTRDLSFILRSTAGGMYMSVPSSVFWTIVLTIATTEAANKFSLNNVFNKWYQVYANDIDRTEQNLMAKILGPVKDYGLAFNPFSIPKGKGIDYYLTRLFSHPATNTLGQAAGVAAYITYSDSETELLRPVLTLPQLVTATYIAIPALIRKWQSHHLKAQLPEDKIKALEREIQEIKNIHSLEIQNKTKEIDILIKTLKEERDYSKLLEGNHENYVKKINMKDKEISVLKRKVKHKYYAGKWKRYVTTGIGEEKKEKQSTIRLSHSHH